jgi:hypothetical protein
MRIIIVDNTGYYYKRVEGVNKEIRFGRRISDFGNLVVAGKWPAGRDSQGGEGDFCIYAK